MKILRFVTVFWFLHTVGGHQDCAGEGVEFISLVLPCAAVITDEVLIFFQARIGVAGQHFAVSVNIDAFALSLFEQLFEVFQVVA